MRYEALTSINPQGVGIKMRIIVVRMPDPLKNYRGEPKVHPFHIVDRVWASTRPTPTMVSFDSITEILFKLHETSSAGMEFLGPMKMPIIN